MPLNALFVVLMYSSKYAAVLTAYLKQENSDIFVHAVILPLYTMWQMCHHAEYAKHSRRKFLEQEYHLLILKYTKYLIVH